MKSGWLRAVCLYCRFSLKRGKQLRRLRSCPAHTARPQGLHRTQTPFVTKIDQDPNLLSSHVDKHIVQITEMTNTHILSRGSGCCLFIFHCSSLTLVCPLSRDDSCNIQSQAFLIALSSEHVAEGN